MTTITTQLLHDTNVAGGWTDAPSVARRICTAVWKATNAFGRITNYQSDVVIDYETILRAVKATDAAQEFNFTYSVGDNGTHLAMWMPGDDVAAYRSHAASVLAYDSGPNTAKFTVIVTRSEWMIDSVTGARYGADRYGLSVQQVTA